MKKQKVCITKLIGYEKLYRGNLKYRLKTQETESLGAARKTCSATAKHRFECEENQNWNLRNDLHHLFKGQNYLLVGFAGASNSTFYLSNRLHINEYRYLTLSNN